MIHNFNKVPYVMYLRKSTRSRGRQVLSLRAQYNELTRFCEFHKLRVIKTFQESHTAKVPGRPEFNEMLRYVRTLGEPVGILSWDADRLLRNKEDEMRIVEMIESGVIAHVRFPTYTYDNSATSKFVLSMQFANGKYYVDRLSELIRFGLREKIRQGSWPGPKPFGYRYDKGLRNIVPDKAEAEIVRRVFEEFSTGNHSLTSIREYAENIGCRSVIGKRRAMSTIQRLLTNHLYVGLMPWKGELHQGRFTPILSKQLFDKVQKCIKTISKQRRAREKIRFAFCGIFRCSCKSMVTAQIAKGNGGTYRYYRCTRKFGKCPERYLPDQALRAQVVALMQRLVLPTDFRRNLELQLRQEVQTSQLNQGQIARNLEQHVAHSEKLLEDLVLKYVQGKIDEHSYLSLKAQLLNEKATRKAEQMRFEDTILEAWIEPFQTFVEGLNRATDLNINTPDEEIADLLRKVGTNHTISNQKTAFELAPEFQFTAQFLTRLRSGDFTPPPVPEREKAVCPVVWWFVSTTRTQFFSGRASELSGRSVHPVGIEPGDGNAHVNELEPEDVL